MKASYFRKGSLMTVFFCLCALPLWLSAQRKTADKSEGSESPAPEKKAGTRAKKEPKKVSAEPQKVTFCSWNLRNWLNIGRSEAERPKGGPKLKDSAEIEATISMLADIRPDLLGLCEMGSAEDLAALQKGLKRRGIDLPHTEWVRAADPDRHVALLSRWPITARASQSDLSYVLDHAELPVQRGILDVAISVTPDYTLRAVGVHLKSRRDVPEADEALMRRNEAHLLRRHVDSILTSAPQTNLLVFGDFNETPDQPAIRAVKGVRGAETALTELELADERGERWTYYFADAETYSRIDYVFASRGILPEIDLKSSRIHSAPDWLTSSDHRPEVVTILPEERTRRPSTRKAATTAQSAE